MRFDSFDFLSPVCSKVITKSESVMDLNTDKQNESKVKKSKPDGDLIQNKSFTTIGEYDWFKIFPPFTFNSSFSSVSR